jgi:hypothetical protein
MNPSTDTALTIDTIAVCDCCSHTGIKVEDFLEGFTDNLPAPGIRVLLRIREPKRTEMGLLLRCCGNEH